MSDAPIDQIKKDTAEQLLATELAAYEHELRQAIKHGNEEHAAEVREQIELRGAKVPVELAAPKKAKKDAADGAKK